MIDMSRAAERVGVAQTGVGQLSMIRLMSTLPQYFVVVKLVYRQSQHVVVRLSPRAWRAY
jgi:hypothetical protein